MSRNHVIRLHGVDGNGVNLVTLADVWRHARPKTEFAAPDVGGRLPNISRSAVALDIRSRRLGAT